MRKHASVALLTGLLTLPLLGCKRLPKDVYFNGATYYKTKKYRAFAFSVVSYVPKGKDVRTADKIVSFMELDTDRVKSKAQRKRFMQRMEGIFKRFDRQYKHYKGRTQFCYRQKFRRQKLLLYSAFDTKSKDLRIFQYQVKLSDDQYQEDTATLCEEANTYFAELDKVAKEF